jgi:hypothetical protein
MIGLTYNMARRLCHKKKKIIKKKEKTPPASSGQIWKLPLKFFSHKNTTHNSLCWLFHFSLAFQVFKYNCTKSLHKLSEMVKQITRVELQHLVG